MFPRKSNYWAVVFCQVWLKNFLVSFVYKAKSLSFGSIKTACKVRVQYLKYFVCIFIAVMVSVYCRCMINVLCLYFAQKPFSTLSRDACSINSSSVNQERLSVLTKPREFEINSFIYNLYHLAIWVQVLTTITLILI